MRTLLVGDIHGCLDELQALLDRAGLCAGDQVVALGDLVDRGPASPAVVALFQRGEVSGVTLRALMGNHEDRHLRGRGGTGVLAASQQMTAAQFGGLDSPAYHEALDWMETLPLWFEQPDQRVLAVHGALTADSSVRRVPRDVLVGKLRATMRLRKQGWWPWYARWADWASSKPRWRGWTVVVGHRHYLGNGRPLVHEHGHVRVVGIDTGCCRGGFLTGLLLPEHRFVRVRAARRHWPPAEPTT